MIDAAATRCSTQRPGVLLPRVPPPIRRPPPPPRWGSSPGSDWPRTQLIVGQVWSCAGIVGGALVMWEDRAAPTGHCCALDDAISTSAWAERLVRWRENTGRSRGPGSSWTCSAPLGWLVNEVQVVCDWEVVCWLGLASQVVDTGDLRSRALWCHNYSILQGSAVKLEAYNGFLLFQSSSAFCFYLQKHYPWEFRKSCVMVYPK